MRPQQTKFALTMRDGSLAIMSFITRGYNPDGTVQFEREPTVANVARECSRTGLDVVEFRPINDTDLPESREYRDAWVDRNGRIEHDMPRARDICRAKLRAARGPLLAALDVEYQRADEAGNTEAKRDVAARKQALRDAPADPRIEAAQTVDDLMRIFP